MSETIDELFARTLSDDDSSAWNAVAHLQHVGSAEVLALARRALRDGSPLERRRAAAVLGQLGLSPRTFVPACIEALGHALSAERDPAVLADVVTAIGHQCATEVEADVAALRALVPAMVAFRTHLEPDVRFALAFTLPHLCEDDAALRTLIELSRDEDSDVRDWATFGLGSLSTVDVPAARDALAANLDDADADVREEALLGLARRRDVRALARVRDELRARRTSWLILEAARTLADPSVLPLLESLALPPGHEDEEHLACVIAELHEC